MICAGWYKIVAFVGWVTAAIGAAFLLASLKSIGSYGALGIGPAIGLIAGGLLLVCQGQLTQAFADTAMNTGKLVELLGGNAVSTANSQVSTNQSVKNPKKEISELKEEFQEYLDKIEKIGYQVVINKDSIKIKSPASQSFHYIWDEADMRSYLGSISKNIE